MPLASPVPFSVISERCAEKLGVKHCPYMLLKFCLLSKPSSAPLHTGSLQQQLLKCNTQILLKECPAYLSKVHCNWSSLLPGVCILSFCGNWMGGGRVISATGATVLCQLLQKVIPGSCIYFRGRSSSQNMWVYLLLKTTSHFFDAHLGMVLCLQKREN